MVSINNLYDASNDAINTSQTGLLDAARFSRLANAASWWKFDQLTDPLKVRGGFQKNSHITDQLFPFIKRVVLQLTSEGLVVRPSDYAYYVNMRIRKDKGELAKCMCQEKDVECADLPDDPTQPNLDEKIKLMLLETHPEVNVEFIDINEVADRLDSAIYPPTKLYPLCYPLTVESVTTDVSLNKSYFQVIPKDVGSIILTYLRFPKDCKYSTTLDPTYNQEVYDSLTSINLEWDRTVQNDLAQRVATLYSQWVDKPELFNSSNQLINQGA